MIQHLTIGITLIAISVISLYLLQHGSYMTTRRWGSALFAVALLSWCMFIIYLSWHSFNWALSQWRL